MNIWMTVLRCLIDFVGSNVPNRTTFSRVCRRCIEKRHQESLEGSLMETSMEREIITACLQ
ncbi:hypothetical protein ALC57_16707 [Trachymyrmex cornetzi]|uniref:Mos1 transposase HTH domain-containing protein n=1 Tax=Trachymyrmex cornetzi TaxID=471704 RepID=A0A195DE42_9HYME|nr:hypothetical protein ALC57_16707 [Trachymyrmex cornetzi]